MPGKRRVIPVIEYLGVRGTIADVCSELRMSYGAVRNRMYRDKLKMSDVTVDFIHLPDLFGGSAKKEPRLPSERTCVNCGRVFLSLKETLCSDECRKERRRANYLARYNYKPICEKKCVSCGVLFSSNDKNRKTCSSECSKARKAKYGRNYYRNNKGKYKQVSRYKPVPDDVKKEKKRARDEATRLRREKQKEKKVKTEIKKSCQRCGSDFTTTKAIKVFCSERCVRAAAKRRRRLTNRAEYTPVDVQCHCCSKTFRAEYMGSKYCSKPCRKRSCRSRNRVSPHQKARKAISSRLREVLYKLGRCKHNSVMKYVGCSTKDFLSHIELKMERDMNWSNYGVFGWHIDHIIPCSAFDLSIDLHKHLCFDKRNLRPMWHNENIKKSDSLVQCDIESMDIKYLESLVSAGIVKPDENGRWVVSHGFFDCEA
jgi:predicted nucleic acid-binding Zn ribbon protein